MKPISKGLVLALLCAASVAAHAANSAPSESQEIPEEIVVTGERSAIQLRTQLMEAEKQAYEIFNRFNDDRRFEISCSHSAPVGSRFTRQVCMAEFEIQAMRGHAQDYLAAMPGTPGDGRLGSQAAQQYLPVEGELQRHRKAYKEKMREIAENHPEFLDAIARYAALSDDYKRRTGQAK